MQDKNQSSRIGQNRQLGFFSGEQQLCQQPSHLGQCVEQQSRGQQQLIDNVDFAVSLTRYLTHRRVLSHYRFYFEEITSHGYVMIRRGRVMAIGFYDMAVLFDDFLVILIIFLTF